ncbi:hypothetical protein ACFSHQ_19645 [Gemmobacter lanyuensis]
MMTGGRRMDAVLDRVSDALGRLATATGRPKAGVSGPQRRKKRSVWPRKNRICSPALHGCLVISQSGPRCSAIWLA